MEHGPHALELSSDAPRLFFVGIRGHDKVRAANLDPVLDLVARRGEGDENEQEQPDLLEHGGDGCGWGAPRLWDEALYPQSGRLGLLRGWLLFDLSHADDLGGGAELLVVAVGLLAVDFVTLQQSETRID